MRSRTAVWFETKIRYEKTMEDGMQKKVSESYVVDALSFTEAENTIIEEMRVYISGEFKVTDLKQAAYGEIFFSDADADDKWYKSRLQFITIDEKTEKEKRIEEVMGGTLIDYVIVSIQETQIMDVFEHNGPKKNTGGGNDVPEYEAPEKSEEPTVE